MMSETLLDIFVPPHGTVGHSAALVAMTGAEDFLEDAMQRFTGLRPRQRAELGNVLVYLMLDGHASSLRKGVFPPGRIPGLHELQPRAVGVGSLLHAKIALLAFAPTRTGVPTHLRLAVLTANFTYTSARRQLELIWQVDAPLDGTARPVDGADVAAAGAFVETLLVRFFHRDEQGLAPKERRLTARLDALLTTASSLITRRKPRFIHSLDRPLYDQIRESFRSGIDKPRNFLLCGSGFFEEPSRKAHKPSVLCRLEDLGVFTPKPRRVVIVEPAEAGAIADWARAGDTYGWELFRPYDSLGHARCLHAKFVYAGYLRDGYASNGWLYLGSGNLSRRGISSHGGMPEGNVETGVVFEVSERLAPEDLEGRLFWKQEQTEVVGEDEWSVGQLGDAPGKQPILAAPPILSAAIETTPTRHLRTFWREDAAAARASISWIGRDWFEVQQADQVPLKDDERPAALNVRDESDRTWVVPVVDAAGRVGWQPSRFDTYASALAALLDFPIRPVEATDYDDTADSGDGGWKAPHTKDRIEQEGAYALHAAAQFIEKVAALQLALPESMIDDWLDHLDRNLRASFPEELITTWRTHRLDTLAHLRQREFRPTHLTDKQRARYFEVLDEAARAWGLR